jgi:PAS domain S-box-containing protein
MNTEEINILLVDDDEDDYILTRNYLAGTDKFNYNLEWEYDYRKALEKIKEDKHDLYLVDFMLGSYSGIELLKEARKHGTNKPLIMLTGQSNYQTDIEAMLSGASDYLVKGELNTSVLERAIRYNIDRYNNLSRLRQQERKYRALFERSLDAIFIAYDDFLIIDANNAFKKLFSFEDRDLGALKLKELFAAPDIYSHIMKRFDESGYIKDAEVVLRGEDGKRKTCLISISRLDAPLKKDLIQGIIKDITSLKETEKELRNTEKLAISGTMARTIAHEIRNPLTNIILALRQLSKKIENGKPDEAGAFIEMAHKNSVHINLLIEELLQSSNPADFSFEKNSLNEIVEAAIEYCKDRIHLKKVNLRTELADNLQPIKADFNQLKRAFVNIITNAVEATYNTENAALTIKTYSENGRNVALFNDNGCGIEPEKIDRMFEPFVTGKTHGMGLGLTTVQNVIRKHNAHINIESEQGIGTTFMFTFEVIS